MRISGITFIHNGVERDYCFEAAIRSMLPVCDEVVVVEAESTDGTRERIEAIQDPKIRIISAPWKPAPLKQESNTDWTKDLGELARESSSHPYIVYVQGDEVLHEKDYNSIYDCASTNRPFFVERYNFWVNLQRLVPHGRVCGHRITRLAPRSAKVTWGSETLEHEGSSYSGVGLYHYGFVRDTKSFLIKADVMLKNFLGETDPRLPIIGEKGWSAFAKDWPDTEEIPFKGTHPAVAHQWLKEKGLL